MQGDRYDSQRAVIGSKLQGKLQDMQVLVTGHVMFAINMIFANFWRQATAVIVVSDSAVFQQADRLCCFCFQALVSCAVPT